MIEVITTDDPVAAALCSNNTSDITCSVIKIENVVIADNNIIIIQRRGTCASGREYCIVRSSHQGHITYVIVIYCDMIITFCAIGTGQNNGCTRRIIICTSNHTITDIIVSGIVYKTHCITVTGICILNSEFLGSTHPPGTAIKNYIIAAIKQKCSGSIS